MSGFQQKIGGLIALNDTHGAISDTLLVLYDYCYRQMPLLKEPDGRAKEFLREIHLLEDRWESLRALASSEAGMENWEQLELASINYKLTETVSQFSALPALSDQINRAVHYIRHLQDYAARFIGKTIAGFRLVELVGMGGFGIVFKARHEYLKQEVAIKISHPIIEGDQFIDELLFLALVPLRHLRHDYIVNMIDAGETRLDDYRRMFVVTEFVAGSNLRAFCLTENKAAPEFVRTAIDIAAKVGEALAYCHSTSYYHPSGMEVTGIKHGDIKPENILLDRNHIPKLTDFMFIDLSRLYKLVTAQPEFVKSRGYATSAFGTYGYMAPEQQTLGIVTERSDIYAFGVLLLEMFGRLIVDRQRPISFDSPDDVAHVLNNRCLPSTISRIVHRATQLVPERRYGCMGEVLGELRDAANIAGVDANSNLYAVSRKRDRSGRVRPEGSKLRLFISYRRDDSAAIAGRIYDWLRAHFGSESVFMDIDMIPTGGDVRQYIGRAISGSDVLLALIGAKWIGESEEGKRRLDSPEDFVRMEIETALRLKIPVIPVLLDNAVMPSKAKLPPSLRDLVRRNALHLDYGKDFFAHMDRLIRSIE